MFQTARGRVPRIIAESFLIATLAVSTGAASAVAQTSADIQLIQEPSPVPSPAQTNTNVTMPALGETVSDGVVTRWLKSVGDVVKAGEPLLEVSTDKVDTEIEAPASGVLLKILVDEGETAKVGATLAIIGPPSPVPSPAQTNTNVTMPALGETVSDGVVTRWLKSVGDVVKVGEPLLEVSTDKVDTEIEAPASGVLLKILVDEGETAKVGATLAIIGPPNSAAKTN